jgi:hypothetical protein
VSGRGVGVADEEGFADAHAEDVGDVEAALLVHRAGRGGGRREVPAVEAVLDVDEDVGETAVADDGGFFEDGSGVIGTAAGAADGELLALRRIAFEAD